MSPSSEKQLSSSSLLGKGDECRTRCPAEGCCCSKFQLLSAVTHLPPWWAVAALFILQTASFLSKTALGTQGNGRVYYKPSKAADYCWRRSRVIKDWRGGEGEEGTGHNLCWCVRGWVLVASRRHSPNPQDLCWLWCDFLQCVLYCVKAHLLFIVSIILVMQQHESENACRSCSE